MVGRWQLWTAAIAILLSLAACVPIPTPATTTLDEPPAGDLAPLRPGEALAVVPEDPLASPDVAACVREELAAALPAHRVLSMDETRQLVLPLLERGQVPASDAAVRAVLAQPERGQKVRELGLRFLIEVDLVEESEAGDSAEQLFAGMGFWKVTDRVAARVVDFGAACCRPGGSVTATGLQGYAHATIWGVIILSSPQTAACHRLSAALVQAIQAPAPRPAAAGKGALLARPRSAVEAPSG